MRSIVVLGLSSLCVALALCLIAACTHKVPEPSTSDDVRQIWDKQMAILERILGGQEFILGDYVRAVDLFEKTTGISGSSEGTYVGKLPGPGLKEDVERWKAWFVENGSSLYFDQTTGTLRLRS